MANHIPQRLLLFRAHRRKKVTRNARVSIPIRFLRYTSKENMDPLTFRILCHALSFKGGWSVNKCIIDTGYTRNAVYRHLSWLIDNGYAKRLKDPISGKNYYRFKTTGGEWDEREEEE